MATSASPGSVTHVRSRTTSTSETEDRPEVVTTTTDVQVKIVELLKKFCSEGMPFEENELNDIVLSD